MSEKTSIKLDQDVIIPSCGFKTAGSVITKEDAGDSYEWLLKNEKGQLVSDNVSVVVVPSGAQILTAPKGKTAVQVDPAGTDATETDTEDEGEPAEGDDGSVTSEEIPVTSEDAAVIVAVKELLTQGKMHLKTIVQQSGLTEEIVAPLLTEANGFRKNQQGWFSNI